MPGSWCDCVPCVSAVLSPQLCIKLENWPRLGSVFRRVCQSGLRPLDLEQLSGRITVALLSEASGKLAIPFAVFTDMGNDGFPADLALGIFRSL